ncbi:MAG TPA: multifunctional CCA addition/repair protein [Gammaproteobacteria bacterium]|nr:multifunctional CCA addition/repair protein [Gammaproteobacteria bacterium]
MDIYLVGGAVRDQLLELPVRERDWVVVGASAQQLLDLGYKPVGKDFPVFLHPQTHEEYALARTERKTGPGYSGFEFHATEDVTLEQDLLRRDLTINAIAQDDSGHLIDPYNGQQDIQDGVLRHVSPAFAEDPVRILRVARFAARFARFGFHVAHSTNALMREMVENGEVDALVAERVWAETQKALGEDQPTRFFEVLQGCGALARIFPAIDAAWPVQDDNSHNNDTPIFCMQVLQQAASLDKQADVRFAALCCGIYNGIESTGREQVQESLNSMMCDLRVQKHWCKLTRTALSTLDTVLKSAPLTASALLELLQSCDAFRQPTRMNKLMPVWQAVADCRKQTLDYDRIHRALQAALIVDARSLSQSGMKGEEIGKAMQAQRLQAIEKILV